MRLWQRLKSVLEWGFFCGVICWLLSTGFSNQLYSKEVWMIILPKVAAGIGIALIPAEYLRRIKGIVLGMLLNLPLALMQVQWPGFGWIKGFWITLISGMICGYVVEAVLEKKLKTAGEA